MNKECPSSLTYLPFFSPLFFLPHWALPGEESDLKQHPFVK